MKNNINEKAYDNMVKKASPNTKAWITLPKAFVIGGLICSLGQLLIFLYTKMGLNEKAAVTLTSITLIFLSALFTGLKIYEKLAKHGGAGTLVPITGFANAVVSPAIEFKSEGFILGVGAKIFIIAGPVILYGIFASVIFGIFYYFFK